MKTNLPNTAILTDGTAVRLDKHDQKWIVSDASWKESNLKLLETNPRAFVNEELARLREKLWNMQTRKIERVEFRHSPPAGLSLGMRNLICLSWNDASKIANGSQWATYKALWEWSGVRLSSAKQDDFWNKFGEKAFYRRIERVRAACGFGPL